MLNIDTVERILKSESTLHVLYDEGYELSFRNESGLQIGINRKSTKRAIGIWIQNTLDPSKLGFSSTTTIKRYAASDSRAHLSAPLLTGPYKGRLGNDCWYITFTEETDARILVKAYLNQVSAAYVNEFPKNSSRETASIKRDSDSFEKIVERDLEDEEALFPEGNASYRVHRHLERNGSLPIRAKAKRLRETGSLACDVCEFDFQKKFGKLGFGYIEAHHTKPVSKLNGTESTNIADLALVCSNCHKMLHRGGSPMDIDELRRLLRKS